jgi:peptidoglycan hydrolase-like protein with peptidoglycan-binding domain
MFNYQIIRMKKVLIATGVAVMALALVAGAQGYAFNTNLTVGSTGPDVVALQTWLISNGYSIPAVVSGAAAKGYFGSQTKAAVVKYQAAVGLPNTGFVGPLTRGKLNAGGTAMSNPGTVATGCPVGYTCTANPGTATNGTTGTNGTTATGSITTPGVPGLMTVTAGPISSTVMNVGSRMAPVIVARVQAQYSDLDVQSVTVDLGPNTAIYNKIFSTIYVTNGTSVLASQPLNGSTVVQSGSDYVVGLAGFHFIVPKGTYKDLVIKADVNTSIDSSYLTGSKLQGTVSIAGGTNNLSGWGTGIQANSLRAVDGAGLNLYNASSIVQGVTINPSLVDNAQANISLDPASPLVASVPVTDTTNNQYLGLPVMVFDVNAQNDNLHLHEVKVNLGTSGTGSINVAYLYQGSTQILSASVSNGVADFNNITDGTNGASIPVNTTVPFTIKVDVTGVTSSANPFNVTAMSSSTIITAYNSIDSAATASGNAIGNTQTVASIGPLFTLSGTPTITKSNITAGGSSVTTFQYTATFNVNVQAIGTNVELGLPASTTAAFGTSTTSITLAQIYQNGIASSTATSTSPLIAAYSQPTGTTLDGASSFVVSRNQSITIPVSYSFTVTSPNANVYAIQLQGINASTGFINFMANQPAWRTTNI